MWQDAGFAGFARDQIAFSKSTDGGRTWSAPVRINRVSTMQAFTPMIKVDDEGNIGVTYDQGRGHFAAAARRRDPLVPDGRAGHRSPDPVVRN